MTSISQKDYSIYQEKERRLGLISQGNNVFTGLPLHYSIEDCLIPESKKYQILDNRDNLTKKGYEYLEKYIPKLEDKVSQLVKRAAFRYCASVENWKFLKIWKPTPKKKLIKNMLIDFIYNDEIISNNEEKELLHFAEKKNFKPILLYIGMATYVIKKASSIKSLKDLIC